MENLTYPISGIRPSKEFAKKGLAQYAVNVGLRCGHDCTYCSSRAMLRCHKGIKELGQRAFGTGYSIVDPDIADKVADDARRLRKRGMVQVCTTVDAWAPEAKELDLGRRCLEALLAQPRWMVRILTKNAAVVEDYDLIRKHKDRVLVGLSLTGTAEAERVLSVVEPHASTISERMSALQKAHKIGLRTYGMLCPLLPGIADAPEQIDELVRFVKGCGAEEVFCEPVNARGNSLTLTEEVLRAEGFVRESDAISKVRRRKYWSGYALGLIRNVQASMRKHMTLRDLRFLLYPGLSEQDEAQIRKDAAGVIWLKPPPPQETIGTFSSTPATSPTAH
jgi:DNA repair photolyase